MEIRYIQPGKPNQNAYIERFNRTYREEVLNAYLFESLDDVRSITESWLQTADLQRDASSRRPRKDSAGDVSREDRGQNLYPRDVYLTGKLTH